jgi:putative FmdB family regulatory protein
MPVYEYQVREGLEGCPECRVVFTALQSMKEDPLAVCPACGASVRRLISRPSVQVASDLSPDHAARHGFSTFKKAGKGTWEKVAGPGVDAIVGDPSTTSEPKSSGKVHDLDI